MAHAYAILTRDRDDTYAYVTSPPEQVDLPSQLTKGVPLGEAWPEDATLEFSPHRPEGLVLTDYLDNALGWLIVSDRLKSVLEEAGVGGVEYLSVRVLNHKGRLVGDTYRVANLFPLVGAVDRDRSVFEADAAEEDKIFTFERLVLREAVRAEGPLMFRLEEEPYLILVRQDLASWIDAEELTGLRFIPTDTYRSLDLT